MAPSANTLLKLTPAGLYCPEGDFFIDPIKTVDRALITHAHADHARRGHTHVLATQPTLDVMRARFGENFAKSSQSVRYHETTHQNGVAVKFIPAGHVLGSAQISVQSEFGRIIVSGDFKRAHDPTCPPFEPHPCDIFISEATFGLPVYRHPEANSETAKLLHSLKLFPDYAHFVGAYSFGKAHRLIKLLRAQGYDDAICVDEATFKLCLIYEGHGITLGSLARLEDLSADDLIGRLAIGAPSSRAKLFEQATHDPITSFASGWMRLRKRALANGGDLPLIISDHADWPELTNTALEIRPQELWITHGETSALIHWAQLNGIAARPLAIPAYTGDDGLSP